MKVDVLLGLQWGDEGKGKVVDVLTPKYDVVARFQGGPNAGHTLEFEGQKYVLRSIPSGIFQGDKVNIIGNGVVLDPALFKAEAEALEASGHPLKERLHISKKAHLILPTHRILDAAYEAAKGDAKVGTTGKGIGPTYTDKVSRNGVRVGDILHNFEQKYGAAKARHEQILKSLNYEYDLMLTVYKMELFQIFDTFHPCFFQFCEVIFVVQTLQYLFVTSFRRTVFLFEIMKDMTSQNWKKHGWKVSNI